MCSTTSLSVILRSWLMSDRRSTKTAAEAGSVQRRVRTPMDMDSRRPAALMRGPIPKPMWVVVSRSMAWSGTPAAWAKAVMPAVH